MEMTVFLVEDRKIYNRRTNNRYYEYYKEENNTIAINNSQCRTYLVNYSEIEKLTSEI